MIISLSGRVFLCLLGLIFFNELPSQNLVPNPSFEEHSYCPVNFNQGKLDIVQGWKQASRGTSDYFHTCSRIVGIPENSFGEQSAREGEAYVGLITFAPSKKNYREYMQAKLDSPLGAGQLYCVRFYVSSADLSEFVTDGLGAVFSNSKIKNDSEKVIPMNPQVSNPLNNVLDNNDDWTMLSDVYRAQGGEKYITLGNFLPDHRTLIRRRNLSPVEGQRTWESAYYYVDDLSVAAVNSRSECPCSIPLIQANMKDSTRWKIPLGQEVKFDNVLFDFDDAALLTSSIEQLTEVAGWMRNNSFLQLQVLGHTDITGPDGYNLELSKSRADAVLGFLESMGVPSSRLSSGYFGSDRPVANNSEATGRALNRRVDFIIKERAYKEYPDQD